MWSGILWADSFIFIFNRLCLIHTANFLFKKISNQTLPQLAAQLGKGYILISCAMINICVHWANLKSSSIIKARRKKTKVGLRDNICNYTTKHRDAALTMIVISLLYTFRSGTLLTYILLRAQRTPLCVRARNTTEKPPGKIQDDALALHQHTKVYFTLEN